MCGVQNHSLFWCRIIKPENFQIDTEKELLHLTKTRVKYHIYQFEMQLFSGSFVTNSF